MLQLWKENRMVQSIERLAKVHKHANYVLIVRQGAPHPVV